MIIFFQHCSLLLGDSVSNHLFLILFSFVHHAHCLSAPPSYTACCLPAPLSLSPATGTENQKYFRLILLYLLWTRVADENRASYPILRPYANNTNLPCNLAKLTSTKPFPPISTCPHVYNWKDDIYCRYSYPFYLCYYLSFMSHCLVSHLFLFPFYLEPASNLEIIVSIIVWNQPRHLESI